MADLLGKPSQGGSRCRHNLWAGRVVKPGSRAKTDVPPVRVEADVQCQLCGAGLTQMLDGAGVRPFSFKKHALQRLSAVLGQVASTIVPLLELQVRAYQFHLAGLGDLPFFNLYRELGTDEVSRRLKVHRTKQQRLARALSDLARAIRGVGNSGASYVFNEARGYPNFEPEEDPAWEAWLRDLLDMRDVAVEELRKKRRRGPRRDGQARTLEHRIARVLSENGAGRASSAAQQAFALTMDAVLGARYRDPKRALARAHQSPVLMLRLTPEQRASLQRAEERARVRGFS